MNRLRCRHCSHSCANFRTSLQAFLSAFLGALNFCPIHTMLVLHCGQTYSGFDRGRSPTAPIHRDGLRKHFRQSKQTHCSLGRRCLGLGSNPLSNHSESSMESYYHAKMTVSKFLRALPVLCVLCGEKRLTPASTAASGIPSASARTAVGRRGRGSSLPRIRSAGPRRPAFHSPNGLPLRPGARGAESRSPAA